MLNPNAIAIVDAPCGEHHRAIKGGINDLVAFGGNVDTVMPHVGIERTDDRPCERNVEILHQRTRLGGRQIVVAEEVVFNFSCF